MQNQADQQQQSNSKQQQQQVQKGWLARWTRKQWSRHWFVLKSGSLTYYRGPAAELCSFLDGVLDLSLIKHIEVQQPPPANSSSCSRPTTSASHLVSSTHNNQQQQQPFTFSLKMWSGECHLLSASSLAERSMWLEAINNSTNGCLLDDETSTDSASSTDSSPTSNLSTRSCDIGLSAVRYRQQTVLSQQQQQNDQIALDKLAISLRTAIKRREQELRLDFSSTINCSKQNNNNNSTSEILKQHNRKTATTTQTASSQQQQIHMKEPPHSTTSQLRAGSGMLADKSIIRRNLSREGVHNDDDDDVEDDDEEEEEDDDDDDDEDDEDDEDDDENEKDREEKDKKLRDEDENEADESETDDDDEQDVEVDDEPEQEANQAFKRRLMCVPQVSGGAKCHTEPKLISRLAAHDKESSSSSSDEDEAEADEGTKKQEQQQAEQCKKQRKRVTFDLSQSTQRLLTSSSGSDSDTSSSRSYSESSLSSVEQDDERAASPTATGNGLVAGGSADGATSAQLQDESSAATSCQPMDTTGDRDEDDWQVVAPEPCPSSDEKNHEEEDKENERREQVARIEELESKYERAQTSIGMLEMRLSGSCASYAQLELTYARLQSELAKKDELSRMEASRLQARIDELQLQLASSELKLFEARDRLLKFEQQQQQPRQRTSAVTTTTPTVNEQTTTTTKPAAAAAGNVGSWLKQISNHQQKPLFLMHHVRHTLAANQQTIGLKLLNQSKQIQRKLNELELKVDKINSPVVAGSLDDH